MVAAPTAPPDPAAQVRLPSPTPAARATPAPAVARAPTAPRRTDPDPFLGAARLLDERSRRPIPVEVTFRPLAAAPPPARTVAVDGSHAVLVDNGAVWVVAVRAAAVTHGSVPTETAPAVHAATPDEAPQQVADAYAALGLDAPRIGSAEAYAQGWRALAETHAARAALDDLGSDDLLLLDGALENLPAAAHALVARVLERAHARDAPVAAVAKRSGLHAGGVPLVPALHTRGPAGCWTVQVPDHGLAHVARLHPAAAHAFRVDTTHTAVLPRLLPLCRDAVYLGYPYPLALAHNTVALTAARVHELRHRLVATVRAHAGPAAYRLLEDFHAVLDDNVP